MRTTLRIAAAALAVAVMVLVPSTPPRVTPPRRERDLSIRITGKDGRAPVYALAAFAASGRAEGDLGAVSTLVGSVLYQDLAFENAFDLLPAESGAQGFPPANGTPPGQLDLSYWRGLGADGLITGVVRQSATTLEIESRIYKVATGEEAFARGYDAPSGQARIAAHTIADEILLFQAGVHGVARTRLAFVSDRGGLRRELGGTFRRFKEVYVADYDGANERRVTSDGDLDMTPSWSPDGTAIAYTSFRPGFQDIFVTRLDDRRLANPTRGAGKNWLPAWSPDGSTIAFTSVRDGNEEIYVMAPDGSSARRLTRSPSIDTSPTWSPDGRQIAFTSNRTGSPQIWVMNADGSGPRALTAEKYCDRPTWSPAPFNEIAYVSKTRTGFDIKVIDLATGEQRQLTFGQGFNESPAYAPNGRHIAFSSTRRGGQQIWTIARTGQQLRQVTSVGNNTMPAWSK